MNVVGHVSTFVFDRKSNPPFTELLYQKPNAGQNPNPKHNGFVIIDNNMITIFANSTYQKWRVESSLTPKVQRLVSKETYDKMAARERGKPLAKESADSGKGAAVYLPFDKVAVVKNGKVWYFKIKDGNSGICKSGDEDPNPKLVSSSLENFPPGITAAISTNQVVYYFFRGDEYCKRPLLVDKDAVSDVGMTEWKETYQVDVNGNQKLVDRKEV